MNIKEDNKEYKKRAFTKSIKVRPKAHDYIVGEMYRLKYKTYAGTLDTMINYYKKDHKERKCKK